MHTHTHTHKCIAYVDKLKKIKLGHLSNNSMTKICISQQKRSGEKGKEREREKEKG